MKNILLVAFSFLLVNSFSQIMNPQPKTITQKFFPDFEELENTTPALQKKKGYTNYKELMTFLNNLVANHPDKISLSFVGESQKGRKIPTVRLTNKNEQEKIKVWMQGGLHGNEPGSTESMLYLLDRLLNDSSCGKILNSIDLMIVPMANIDGYLKQDRYAANGLDLNRDQTKLQAKETVLLKQAFSDFNPALAVDFHEYKPYRKDFAQLGDFGITSLYDAMFLYSGNLNVPKNLRTLTDTLFVQDARELLDNYNLTHHNYVSSSAHKGDIHFSQGSTHSRSSATNNALTNCISSLIEVRGVGIGRTSFKRRIHTAFVIASSYLKTASENMNLIKSEIAKANKLTNDAVVTSSKTIEEGIIKCIDVHSEEIIELEVTIRNGLKSKPELVRERPVAYLIDSCQIELIEKLKVLGIEVERLSQEEKVEVETYVVSEYKKSSEKYEKMWLQKVKATIITEAKIFPKGTYKIVMNQQRANIVLELLEPESPNSFVAFGVLKTKQRKTLPIYRLMK